MAERALERRGVGGVDLERHVGDALHGLDRRVEHGRLVQPGDADVDVEDVRAGLGLRHRLAEDVGDVALGQRGPELLLAGGVDALADDDGVVEWDLDGARAGADDGERRHWRPGAGLSPQKPVNCRDVRRRGAAAAADHRGAGLDERGDVARELLRPDGEDGASVDDLGEPGVGLDDDRERGAGGEALHEREHAVGTEAAVEADRVGVEAFEERGDAVDVRAG